MLSTLLSNLQLEHLKLSGPLPMALLQQQTGLISLDVWSLDFNTFDFTSFTSLQHIRFINAKNWNLTMMAPLETTLQTLFVTDGQAQNYSRLSRFAELTSFECSACSLVYSPTENCNIQVPPKLERFVLKPSIKFRRSVPWPGATTIFALSIHSISGSSVLTEVELEVVAGQVPFVDLTFDSKLPIKQLSVMPGPKTAWQVPSSVEHLRLGGLIVMPSGLTDCENLTSLALLQHPHWSSFEDLTHLTGLRSVSLQASDPVPQAVFEDVLSKLPSNSIEELTVNFDNAVMNLPASFATHFGTALKSLTISTKLNASGTILPDSLPSSLEKLDMSNTKFSNGFSMNWATWVQHFPNMIEFKLEDAGISTLFPSAISSWSGLRSLKLSFNRISGSIPANFFTSLPQLEHFDVSHNLIIGELPHSGWSALRVVNVESNKLTGWSHLLGSALAIRTLNVASNELTSIPPDSELASMTSLEKFIVSENPNLGSDIPLFWVNHPTISILEMQRCGVQGSLPNLISAPRLQKLFLGHNRLEGPLADFNWTGLDQISIQSNNFSGGIPASWSQTLKVRSLFDVSDNSLSGDLPSTVVHPLSYDPVHILTLNFSHNQFTGPSIDLRALRGNVYYSFTNLDLCAVNPNITSAMYCYVKGVASVCDCTSTWLICDSTAGADCQSPSSPMPTPGTAAPAPNASPSASPTASPVDVVPTSPSPESAGFRTSYAALFTVFISLFVCCLH